MAVLAQLVIVELRGRADVEALAERKLVRGAGDPRYQRTAPIGRCYAAELGGVEPALTVVIDLGEAAARGQREAPPAAAPTRRDRSEEHTSELQSLLRISYAASCLNKKTHPRTHHAG